MFFLGPDFELALDDFSVCGLGWTEGKLVQCAGVETLWNDVRVKIRLFEIQYFCSLSFLSRKPVEAARVKAS